MTLRSMLLVFVLAVTACAADDQPPTESEAVKKERLFQQQLSDFRRVVSVAKTADLPGSDATNFVLSTNMAAMFRANFESTWIHSSFGLRWDEVPPPTIRGTNATAEVDKFVSENGWNMVTNEWVFLIRVETEGRPIRGLPWEVIKERTFKAATHHGVLYIPLRGYMPMGSSGLAYNPRTNRFHSVSAFKHIGDHWYVWTQSDSVSDRRSFYEGEKP
jgi:hypothetical protein